MEDPSFWQSSRNPTKDWEAEVGETGVPVGSSKALLAFNHMPWDSGLSQQARSQKRQILEPRTMVESSLGMLSGPRTPRSPRFTS